MRLHLPIFMAITMKYKLLPLLLLVFFVSGCSPSNQGGTQASSTTIAPIPAPTPERYRQELEIVRRGNFKKQRLLNKSEESLYWRLEDYCSQNNFQIFAQVSLGEILSTRTEDYRFVNSKRVDFCITDSNLMPVAVVEYQGSGHKNNTSDERDAVKRAAVENANVFYIEINVGEERQAHEILDRYLMS